MNKMLRYGMPALTFVAALCSNGGIRLDRQLQFSSVIAGERDGGGDNHRGDDGGGGYGGGSGGGGGSYSGGGGGSGGDGSRGGYNSEGGSRNGGGDTGKSGLSQDQQGSGNGVSYDASKNMLRLNLRLGSHEEPGHRELESHHNSFPGRNAGLSLAARDARGEKDGSRQLGSIPLRPLNPDEWHHEHALQALESAIKPVQTRYQQAIMAPRPPEALTVFGKTKAGIGGLSFEPDSVLAVDIDPVSKERAEALGFKPEWAPDGQSHVVRFLTPPGVDAIRGQELLSKELPGHQFELNKIYRLYRAAMRAESEPSKSAQPAPPSGGPCAGDHCVSRKLIHWQDTFGTCARGLRVGVIDTDIDIGHPAFKGRHIQRNNFAPENRPAAPDWHGTGVLALLAGDPDSAAPGLIPDADFFEASVFFSEQSGEMATDTTSLLKALQWMEANKVKLINMSFAGPRDELVKDEIEHMASEGVIFVAAAGNEGPTAEPSYPAAYPQVIAVTAITDTMHNYRYANRGKHIDVAAPGVDIWTAVPGGQEGYHSGTSFAAPYVTGILAVLPRDKLVPPKEPLLDGLPVVDLGSEGRDPVYGRGLLLAPATCTPPLEMVVSASQ